MDCPMSINHAADLSLIQTLLGLILYYCTLPLQIIVCDALFWRRLQSYLHCKSTVPRFFCLYNNGMVRSVLIDKSVACTNC